LNDFSVEWQSVYLLLVASVAFIEGESADFWRGAHPAVCWAHLTSGVPLLSLWGCFVYPVLFSGGSRNRILYVELDTLRDAADHWIKVDKFVIRPCA